MTQFKPYIIVNRLVITKSGHYVYDEIFHNGVNIIRGKNSSGKSTIADFIFYGLGGDLTKWKEEAKVCDFTFMEVSLNGNIFTLKREISEKSRRGMDIYPGTFEAASSSGIEGWLRYQYNATENKESYYQAILKELNIPYSKSDDNNSITLHQLLRLMYVDQMTSLDRLFKFDRFDSPNKRKAIGELMIGLSDYDLYEYRVKALKLERTLDTKVKQIKILHKFFGTEVKSLTSIDEEISQKQETISFYEKELRNYALNDSEGEDKEIIKLREEVLLARTTIRESYEERTLCAYDISDSQHFVRSLHSRLEAIHDSSNVIHALSDIGFYFCPSCFQKVNSEKLGCSLCGSELNLETTDNDPTFKIRKEIEFQITESNRLITIRQERLSKIEVRVSQEATDLEKKILMLESLESPMRDISTKNRTILIKIGSANNQIDQLNNEKERFGKLHDLYEERDQLQKDLNNVKDEINRRESKLEKELTDKKRVISNLTKSILQADIDHEEIFIQGKFDNFDFGEDRVSIDERVLFSASSMVYLKNAFRLSLLQASCLDSSYIYPRFLLMDNIEDKGMMAERSHLFQREIIRVSSEIEVPHQIIFTTSMIDPDLEYSNLCVGIKYDKINKSLNFSQGIL